MKIVIAIDSFKGSLSSLQAAGAVKEGIMRVCPDAQIVIRPAADGGEGTTEALVLGLGGKKRTVCVTGPDGRMVEAVYGVVDDGKTAVMEMAQAAGLTLVSPDKRDPRRATTYGVGEMIRDAVCSGVRKFIIGIGGSATTDGGAGMLQALGVGFYDEKGRPVGRGIEPLDQIAAIDTASMLPQLSQCTFQIACDVKNPLCGPTGAVYVYGAQKGVGEEEKPVLDQKMAHFAKMTAQAVGQDFSGSEGAGAAGGLGFAMLSYLPNVVLRPGIEMMIEAVGLEKEIQDADIVITGEGRMDAQTAKGKLPVGVAQTAKKYKKTVIAFAGSAGEDAGACNACGIDAIFPIVREIMPLKTAMQTEVAEKNLMLTAEQVFRLYMLK